MTARQVRIANLVKGDNLGLDLANTTAMLNQDSAITLKNKFGQSDGIRSTKAFMTSVTPHGSSKKPSLIFTGEQSQEAIQPKGPRKVFGAQDYLERQK